MVFFENPIDPMQQANKKARLIFSFCMSVSVLMKNNGTDNQTTALLPSYVF